MNYKAKQGDIIKIDLDPQAGNQAKILDLSQRNAEYIEVAPIDIILEVIDIIKGFIEYGE